MGNAIAGAIFFGIVAALVWGVGSIIAWDLDPGHWPQVLRALAAGVLGMFGWLTLNVWAELESRR